jgi:dolichol-phosphate mannosyltransferase
VLGSRWVQGGGVVNWPWYRQVISRAGSLYARLAVGIRVRDVTSGFMCFRREVLEAIDFDSVENTGCASQIEMTYRAIRKGFRVKETPSTFVERERGASKMSGRIVLEAILRVPGLRFRVGA